MNSAPTTLALSRLTGRPVAAGSAVAMSVPASVPAITAAAPSTDPVPKGLERILRPNASQRWILPQLAAITPTYIESTLRGAFSGGHVQAWELFDLMEDTWPRLAKDLNELKRAVIGLDWNLHPWEEEDEPATESANERMKLVSSALWRMRPDPAADENAFDATLYDILDAWGKGVSVLEVDWHIRRAGQLGDITAPRATFWVHPSCYAWGQSGRLGLNLTALEDQQRAAERAPGRATYRPMRTYGAQEVIDFPPAKFLIGVSKAKSGSPLVGALLRPLAWWWCAANFSADWVMNLAQVFGLPFRWANYASGSPQATIDAIAAMLENMGSAGWAAFPEGTTLELKEASKSGDSSPQGDLLDRADKNCDLLILGQTLTSEQGDRGSQALGKVHSGVREDVIKAAANFCASVINDQLIPAILELNYGDTEECPEMRPVPCDKGDQTANATRDQILLASGVEMPRDWLYKRHDIPLPRKGEEVVKSQPAPSPFGGGFGQPRSPGGESETPADKAETEDPEMETEPADAKGRPVPPTVAQVNRLAFAFAEDLKPLRDRLEAIIGIDDPAIRDTKLRALRDSLPSLLKDINADPESARVLADAMAAGMLKQILPAR